LPKIAALDEIAVYVPDAVLRVGARELWVYPPVEQLEAGRLVGLGVVVETC
jgi:hypothetical protein